MASLTSEIGQFVSGLTIMAIPEEALAAAKVGFTDCFGVMIAGAREPVVGLVDRELGSADGAQLARLFPGSERRNVEDAALINGVAAHVLDYDDVTLDGHPSAVLVPAILAQGEALGSSGAEMLTAYVAGYEVWTELLLREPVPLHQKGWHPTAVRGPIAAAAACAKLRGLDANATSTALAIAVSMAGGVVANFGSMTKCFQVGRAAQTGVIAARLSAAGLTASSDALEHKSGYLAAFSPAGGADLSRPFRKDKEWHLIRQGLNVKRYPICYATHRAIDGALDLASQHALRASDVDRVSVATGEMQMVMLRNARPKTALEAKFSLQFGVAAALVARNVGLAQLTDDFVCRPDIQELIPRISAITTTETMKDSAFAPSETVAVTTKDGKVFSTKPIEFAKGSTQRPLSRNELLAKFVECLGEAFTDRTKIRTFEKLMSLESLNSAEDLVPLQ